MTYHTEKATETSLLKSAIRRPLYQQVYSILLERIRSGQWRPGERVPAEQELARQVGVSIGTLRRAVEMLVAEGILIRQEGIGTAVRTFQTPGYWNRFQPVETIDGTQRYDTRRLMAFEKVLPDANTATILQIPQGQCVWRILRHILKVTDDREQVKIADEIFLSVEAFPSLTPALFLTGFAPRDSLCKFYERELGVVVTQQKCSVQFELLEGELARQLQISGPRPALRLARTSLTYGRRPFELRISHIDPDNMQITFDLD